jgi:O-antigen/teichoic acid export membrane protein
MKKLLLKAKKIMEENDVHKIITTVFAQGMLSITNFSIGILLAKFASKEEYGIYVLFFSFVGFLTGFHNAFFSSPLMVLAGQKEESERTPYVVSISIARNYFFVPVLIIFSASLVVYNLHVLHDTTHIILSVFISLVIMTFTAKEYQRTVHFTLLNTNVIFWMDFVMMVTVFASIVIPIYLQKVNALTGLLVLCAGYTSSYAYAKFKNPYRDRSRLIIKEALKENIKYGKWLMLGIFSSIFQNRAYIYITTAFIGLSALADVSASRLFLMPMSLLSGSIIKIMVAKGSLMVSKNEHKKFRKFLIYFMVVLSVGCILYVALILLLSDVLIGILGPKYLNIKGLILLWGIYVLVMSLKSMLTTGIIVYRRFKEQAMYDLIGAVTVIVTCFILVAYIGSSGAIISLIAGEFIIFMFYVYLFLKIQREINKLEPAADMQALEMP